MIVTPGRIEVQASLEGDQFLATNIGETLDFLTFEVATRTQIRLIAISLRGTLFLTIGQVVGGGEPFDEIRPPNTLYGSNLPTPPEFSNFLDPGTYVVQVAVEAYEDLGPDFIPVENTSDIISTVPYRFALEGNVRGLEFLEGNRDRTFTVTQVPEPSAAWLSLAALACAGRGWRGQHRKP